MKKDIEKEYRNELVAGFSVGEFIAIIKIRGRNVLELSSDILFCKRTSLLLYKPDELPDNNHTVSAECLA